MSAPNDLDYRNAEITRVVPLDDAGIAEAAALIRDERCVAVPTETVYGLAADATNTAAVARIYEAKGRPGFNPLIVHVSSAAAAEALAVFDDRARDMAERFWPGPLTLVLLARPGSPIAAAVVAGLPTIALRVSAHPAMRLLIEASEHPLAAPSANASGGISPTTADHVLRSLGGRLPLIVDGGPTSAGLESTIVAITGGEPRLLRPGPITAETLGIAPSTATRGIAARHVEAPGQLASHYRPSKPLRLNETDRLAGRWLIGFGGVDGDANLSPDGDLGEAARLLYAMLHAADASDAETIAVAPIPGTGIGAAINDRLRRAAAP